MLPAAKAGPGGAEPLVALFTATSAVCVTGLSPVNFATYWSPLGEAIILILIQVGGLGIMTGATVLSLLVTRKLRLSSRLLAQAETPSLSPGDMLVVLKLVIAATLLIEALVAAALTLHLWVLRDEPLASALWHGVFHAVSSFTNAGFSNYDEGLGAFAGDVLFMTPICLAVIAGGLGFPVIHELLREPTPRTWSLHTRLTLVATAALLVVGALCMGMLEWGAPATLGPLEPGDRALNAFFFSAMARNAGLNTIDISALQPETLGLTKVLMMIGGGSASTAGGIKVTTFVILGLVVWAEIRGEADVTAFRRRISSDVQRQAVSVALLSIGVVCAAALILMILTPHDLEASLFEAVSAFTTTGLSLGVTETLPPAGQVVIILLMFVGRIGTITFATALALQSRRRPFRYPEERPIVG